MNRARRLLTVLCLIALVPAWAPEASAEFLSAFPLADVVKSQAEQLAKVESTADALTVFATAVGPALGLRDAAGTVGAKGIPAKMAKELRVAELSASAENLMAALAAWQWADGVTAAIESSSPLSPSVSLPSPAREAWIMGQGPWTALPDLLRLARAAPTDLSEPQHTLERTKLALAAHRLALEASQQAMASWWELHGWKDRVRNIRGRARLCGTWQWTIHNHQNHGEQKTTMIFPPLGRETPGMAAPAEIVILGDSVYLRWEMDGRMQEDSLLFIKDGTRLEGSFVNNLGGWGSITGKRTAGCQS